MTVVLAGRAPATFEIKSANLPLVALLLKSPDVAALAGELAARFGDIPDFFDHDPLVIDLSPLQAQPEAAVEFGALVQLLRSYRVLPVAVRGGSPQQMSAALQAGLAAAPEAVAGPGLRPAQSERDDWIAGQARNDNSGARNDNSGARNDNSGAGNDNSGAGSDNSGARNDKAVGEARHSGSHPGPDPGSSPSSALIVDKPLRSGQQVYARGRDLVMLSMVNAGAEVIADGHIHVYAPLRGRAIAGARGNTEARILALCLEPELISIAGVYRTSEVPLPANVLSKPTQVRLVGGVEGKLVMDPLAPSASGRGRG